MSPDESRWQKQQPGGDPPGPASSSSVEREMRPVAVQDLENLAMLEAETGKCLHPSSMLFEAISKIRRFILPALIGVASAARGGGWGAAFAAVFFAASFCVTLIRYFTLRYRVRGSDFVITEGLLFQRVRSVPVRRIQNMDLVQNPLHRIFGVAEVRIETASGTRPEAILRVLTLTQIEELRAAIFLEQSPSGNAPPAALPDRERTDPNLTRRFDPNGESIPKNRTLPIHAAGRQIVYSIPLKHLVLAGLTSNRGLVLLSILLGYLFQGGDPKWNFEFMRGYLPERQDPVMFTALAILTFLGLILLLRFLGVAWYVLRFQGYQLCRSDNDLRISCGLFTKVSATVPIQRIQFISVQRPLLMRWLKLASIRIETAGGAGNEHEDAATTVSRRWFLPVVDEGQVGRILEALRPGLHWESTSQNLVWHGVSPVAESRLLRMAILTSLLIAGLGLGIARPWGWVAGVVAFPLIALLAKKRSRVKRYGRTHCGLVYQSGLYTRKLSFAFYDRIQTLQVVQSPFDRRWRMATLSVDTAAAGPANHAVDVPYLDESFAFQQFQELQIAAAEHRPTWA